MKIKTDGRKLAGGLIIAVGIIFLLDNFWGGFDFWGLIWKFWPLVLVLLGAYILKNQGRFKSDVSFDGGNSESKLFGDLNIDFDGREIGGNKFSTLIGDIRLNLLNASFGPEEQAIDISFLLGDVNIILPHEAAVNLSVQSFIGDVRIGEIKRDGFFKKFEHVDEKYDSAEKKLRIVVSGLIGDLNISKIK